MLCKSDRGNTATVPMISTRRWIPHTRPNGRYHFRIRAFNGHGASPFTHQSFSTLPARPAPPRVTHRRTTSVTLGWEADDGSADLDMVSFEAQLGAAKRPTRRYVLNQLENLFRSIDEGVCVCVCVCVCVVESL